MTKSSEKAQNTQGNGKPAEPGQDTGAAERRPAFRGDGENSKLTVFCYVILADSAGSYDKSFSSPLANFQSVAEGVTSTEPSRAEPSDAAEERTNERVPGARMRPRGGAASGAPNFEMTLSLAG